MHLAIFAERSVRDRVVLHVTRSSVNCSIMMRVFKQRSSHSRKRYIDRCSADILDELEDEKWRWDEADFNETYLDEDVGDYDSFESQRFYDSLLE